MMRQSFPDFATVLKETESEYQGGDYVRRSRVNIASAVFSAGFNPVSKETYATQRPAPTFDVGNVESDENRLERERLELSKRMESQSAADIRLELGLRFGMNRTELARLRRNFAASNHPDRLPQEFRLAAEQRMKTANALLDSAMTTTTNGL
ncbi:hypothetical protein [Brucella thiophenivorans]|uniref:J domain-containing protein n=1 Tax=Brucella thiophenivorans TaxID=571255 RepID=A0A256FYP5_9HYPH|nr:hypothetical protein CEV31_1317 [Brucella thiophenivorans]